MTKSGEKPGGVARLRGWVNGLPGRAITWAATWMASAVSKMDAGPRRMLAGVLSGGGIGEKARRGTAEMLEGVDSMPWLHAAARKIGTRVGQTEWTLTSIRESEDDTARALSARRVLRAQGRSGRAKAMEAMKREAEAGTGTGTGTGTYVRAEMEHPLFAAISQPNPFMGQQELMSLTSQYIDVVGDAFWLVQRDGAGMPVGYWPVPPHWVEMPTVQRPTYVVAWRAWRAEVPESEVVFFHQPSPLNPYGRGSGFGWALGDELQVDEYAAKMAAALFVNRARPDVVVYGLQSDTEKADLEMAWEAKTRGFQRAFRPFFMTGEVKFQEFNGQTLDQLMYPAMRQLQRDMVIQVPGIPPELFGIVQNSNRATITAAEYLFDSYVIEPRVESMRGVLQRHVSQNFDPRLVLCYVSPVRADAQFELEVRKAAQWAYDQNEWRAMVGASPVENPVHLAPMWGYMTTDLSDPSTRPGGAPVSPPDDDKPDDGQDLKPKPKPKPEPEPSPAKRSAR